MATRQRKTTRTESAERTALDPRLFDAMFVAPLDLLPGRRELEEGGDDYGQILESICGTIDDSQPVEQYDGTLGVTRAFVDAHQSAVVQVQWNNDLAAHYSNPGDVNGVRWGSGTMISPDLMLTCGHLFDQTGNGWTRPQVNGSTATISPQEIATRMHVNFNYQVDPTGTLRAEVSFPITQLVEYRLGGIDMAICRIGGSPGNTYGFTGVAAGDVAVAAMLAIIGHPAGQPKRIEAGPATAVVPGRLSYNDIDTLGGNSGSGILGPAGTLVGVHTNGGCNAARTGSNFGVPIATIRGVSPTLQNLGTPTNTILDAIHTRVDVDIIGTLAFRDTNTWRDQIGTLAGRDTNRILDNISTMSFLDAGGVGGTGVADSLQEHIDPGRLDPVVNPPVVRPAVGALRPFALQGEHRFPGAEVRGGRDEMEAMLEQYEQALEEVATQLGALQEEYAQAYAQYVETYGADG